MRQLAERRGVDLAEQRALFEAYLEANGGTYTLYRVLLWIGRARRAETAAADPAAPGENDGVVEQATRDREAWRLEREAAAREGREPVRPWWLRRNERRVERRELAHA